MERIKDNSHTKKIPSSEAIQYKDKNDHFITFLFLYNNYQSLNCV